RFRRKETHTMDRHFSWRLSSTGCGFNPWRDRGSEVEARYPGGTVYSNCLHPRRALTATMEMAGRPTAMTTISSSLAVSVYNRLIGLTLQSPSGWPTLQGVATIPRFTSVRPFTLTGRLTAATYAMALAPRPTSSGAI